MKLERNIYYQSKILSSLNNLRSLYKSLSFSKFLNIFSIIFDTSSFFWRSSMNNNSSKRNEKNKNVI